MNDLKKHFERASGKEARDNRFYESVDLASRFLAEVIAELNAQGFHTELDTERTQIKKYNEFIELSPVLKIRYKDKSLPENGPEKLSFNLRVHRIPPQNGLSVALGLAERQTKDRLLLTMPHITEDREYSQLVCGSRSSIEQVTQYVVSKFATLVARHGEVETLHRNVDKHYRPRGPR